MSDFFKKYSSLILKFVLNQIALTVFGLVLYLSTYRITWLGLLTSVFSLLFYCYLLMNASVEFGKQEKIRIDGGRAEFKPLNGLYASLIANSVNIILAVCIIVGKLASSVADGVTYASLFEKLSVPNTLLVSDPAFPYNLLGVCQPIFNMLNGMYMGIINTFAPNNSSAFLLALIPSVFVSAFGYYAGLKDMAFTKIFDQKPKEKN